MGVLLLNLHQRRYVVIHPALKAKIPAPIFLPLPPQPTSNPPGPLPRLTNLSQARPQQWHNLTLHHNNPTCSSGVHDRETIPFCRTPGRIADEKWGHPAAWYLFLRDAVVRVEHRILVEVVIPQAEIVPACKDPPGSPLRRSPVSPSQSLPLPRLLQD